MSDSDGTRLGRLLASEPELTQVQTGEDGQEFLRRFSAYITAEGCDVASMFRRMECLQLETILQEKSYAEVLADLP